MPVDPDFHGEKADRMRHMRKTTSDAIRAYFEAKGNGSELARCAGLEVTDFYNARGRGRASLEVENAIRRCLGMSELHRQRYMRLCISQADAETARTLGIDPRVIWKTGLESCVAEAYGASLWDFENPEGAMDNERNVNHEPH